MEVPRVQYVTSADGVRIAYTAIGHGAPLVFPANAWGDIDVFATSSMYGELPELVLSSGFQAVLYDGRGSGGSDRNITDMSQEARLADLEAVVDRLALDRFALNGLVHGTTTAHCLRCRAPRACISHGACSAVREGRRNVLWYTNAPRHQGAF
jgi:pimeloyl-ACP methyl ester carboxylesterase